MSTFGAAPAAALPIELISFNAKAQNQSIDLTWSTASEKNNDHFDLQRSGDATDWSTIATIKGNGTTATKEEYAYTDAAPISGVNYYRLKQMDYDGGYQYSPIVSAVAKSGKGGISVFPNPAQTMVHVYSPVDYTDGSVTIHDISGRLVKTYSVNSGGYNVSDLPAGVYAVRVLDVEGLVREQSRFAKQ